MTRQCKLTVFKLLAANLCLISYITCLILLFFKRHEYVKILETRSVMYAVKSQRRNISSRMKEAYQFRSGWYAMQKKRLIPKIVCKTCLCKCRYLNGSIYENIADDLLI